MSEDKTATIAITEPLGTDQTLYIYIGEGGAWAVLESLVYTTQEVYYGTAVVHVTPVIRDGTTEYSVISVEIIKGVREIPARYKAPVEEPHGLEDIAELLRKTRTLRELEALVEG